MKMKEIKNKQWMIMKKFLKKALYFSIPLIMVMGPCFYILYTSGELYTKETIIKPLREHQLIGLAYTEINEYYKQKNRLNSKRKIKWAIKFLNALLF